jgi:hypothetical protein
MFKSNTEYTNRYNDKYKWVEGNETTYRFEMAGDSMKYCRFGGREGVEGVDTSDLGMFDPSGGPYVCLGMEIDGKPITRLYSREDGMYAECT